MTPREKCPACGEARTQILVDLPYAAPPVADYLRMFYRATPRCDFQPLAQAQYRLAECPACQCIFQHPVPDDSYLAQFYGEGLYGEAAAPAAPAPLAPYLVQQNIRELMMVVRFLQPAVPRPRVLDFGTGNGDWALLSAGTGVETHASDLSDHAFPHLTSRGVICHAAGNLPPAHFDFINTEQVFEHLPNPAAQLQRLARCLRPGGVVKIGVPHDPRLRQKLRQPDWTAPKNSPASLNAVAPIEHLNHFEPSSLRAMAVQAGLEPLAIVGWSLAGKNDLAPYNRPRARLVRWLRAKLGDTYQPYHALTQTAFFRAPG